MQIFPAQTNLFYHEGLAFYKRLERISLRKVRFLQGAFFPLRLPDAEKAGQAVGIDRHGDLSARKVRAALILPISFRQADGAL